MNRHARRSAEKTRAARHSVGERAAANRVQAAQAECQRLGIMYQNCQQALTLLGQIPEVAKPEGWTDEDGDPNGFKVVGAEDFMARLVECRERLILAHEEFYLALEAADPANPPVIEIPQRLVQ
ncbi:MAG: hypothetical protein ACREQL_09360 [Candidatus Binatia bacterium]